ncbi:MAG: hypothetical protein NTU80_05030 [Verrucomicrobia bacterium]|nr:hypothetical protein [Verrucomicrobiota bacterium]
MPRPLIDTGVLLALLDARDEHHPWAKQMAATHPQGFDTCEAVITELIYHIRASERAKHAVLAMIESQWLRIHPVLPKNRVAVSHCLEKYHPRADYAYACLVSMYEQFGSSVITTDKVDSTLYRTRLGNLIQTEFPSSSLRRA